MIKVAVLGYGTVGSGVLEVFQKNQEILNQNVGEEIELKYVLDRKKFPGDPVERYLIHDFETIVNDPEIKIVVEVMGGLNPSFDFVKRCLENQKSVCTSNKELVAQHGTDLLLTAKEHHVNFLFEASCGGGIPIIRPLYQSLTADRIDEVSGILNGTTNYILSKMTSDGYGFEEVLKRAQDKGYAERDPQADVEGYDACRKIAILSSLAFGNYIDYKDIYTDEELHDLLEKPKNHDFVEIRTWAVIWTFASTGIRARELRELLVKNVDLYNRTIIVNKTKNKKARILPISHSFNEVLEEYLQLRSGEGEDYLFCSVYNTQLAMSSLQKCIKNYCNSRGIKKTSLHLFRHTFITNAVNKNVSPLILKRMP